MESSTGAQVVPTAVCELPLDEGLWVEIQRFASAGGARVTRGGRVRTGGGTDVYVVVVERAADGLPSAALLRQQYRLTRREAEVALLLARRLTGTEIARQLGVTIHTARRHTEQVLLKLGIGNRHCVRALLGRLRPSAQRAA